MVGSTLRFSPSVLCYSSQVALVALFTINVLRDLVSNPGCCRKVTYVWAIRAECHTAWFSQILKECRQLALQNDVQLDIEIWITQDKGITTEEPKTAGAACRSATCRCQSKTSAAPRVSISSRQSTTSATSVDEKVTSKSQCCCAARLEAKEVRPWHLHYGKPDIYKEILEVVRNAQGETGIAVCGPTRLSSQVRNTVVRISDERAVKKGSGAEAIYLHVENQS